MAKNLCIILFVQCFLLTNGAPKEDVIVNLPGLMDQINFNHYSGYLNSSVNRFLHYWFVESESNPSKDPVILWLNGGPGCSSMDGLLNELGPYHISNDGKMLFMNDYAWNKRANVIFLESPACVGFSYSTADCKASDDSTSLENYLALLHFFKKFPEFRDNDFYVTGESYAGIYVPTLAVRILQGNTPKTTNHINIKGYAVGNGLSSYHLNDDSIIFFAFYHGLIGEDLWKALEQSCCKGGVATENNCPFSASVWPQCQEYVSKAINIIYNSGLNMYNLYGKCVHPTHANFTRHHADFHNLFYQAKLLGTSPSTVELDPPCTDSTAMRQYLNDNTVRQALHIPDQVQNWDICNEQINLNYHHQYPDMAKQYSYLTQQIKGLIYNGDVDMACNFLGDAWFVEDLKLKLKSPRRIWKIEDQVGGFVKQFQNLDLLTVRGAGHMVPQDKPVAAFKMIDSFINDLDY